MTQENPTNAFWQKIIGIADRNGWTVLEVSNNSVRLQGPPNNFLTVTVEAEFGYGIDSFLETLKAPTYERYEAGDFGSVSR